MAQDEPRLELPAGSPYSNWGEWAALLIGAIDDSLTDLDAWVDTSKPDVLTTLDEIRWILPQLAACVAALGVVPLKFFVVRHKETQNTAGGGSSADTYNQHTLNDEIYDPDGLVSLSSGNAVIVSGKYLFIGVCASYKGSNVHATLYDVTNSARIAHGISDYNSPSDNVGKHVLVVHAVELTSTTTIRLELYTQDAVSVAGLGVANNKAVETYAYLVGIQA